MGGWESTVCSRLGQIFPHHSCAAEGGDSWLWLLLLGLEKGWKREKSAHSNQALAGIFLKVPLRETNSAKLH